MRTVIEASHVTKIYYLGQIGTGTLSNDIKVWWAKKRGEQNPLSKIGYDDLSNSTGDKIVALRDISFSVEHGEVLGIIGRNGAGKSTMLKILSRITSPTIGMVKVRGRVASLLEVGTGFHPELTGRENIYLNGAILGMSHEEVRRKFDEIVTFAEVERFIDTPVKRYSSGMYVRLAFAVAAHLEPEILLVDEVLAVGDAEFQKKCLGKMGDVAREGRTILFISHNMTAMINLCRRALLISKGQIIQDGPVEETVNYYLSSGNEGQSEKIWDDIQTAPGSQRAKLHAVRIFSQGGRANQFDIDKSIDLEVDYWNLRPNSKLVVQIKLHDSMGTVILESFNTPEASGGSDSMALASLQTGLYRSRCRIPGNFLNDGQYFVTVIIASLNPAFAEVNEKNIISFSIFDTGTMRTAGLSGKWHGMIRTPLDWDTKFIKLSMNSPVTEGVLHE